MNTLNRIYRYVRPYRWQALFSLVMLVAMVACDLAIPRLVERIIDDGIRKSDMAVVLLTALVMFGVTAVDATVAVLNNLASVRVGESVARDIREDLFRRVQTMPRLELDRFPTGVLMVRIASDSAAIQRFAQVSLRIGTRAPLSMVGSVIFMFVTSPSLALSVMPFLAVAAVVVAVFSARMEPHFRSVQQKLDRLNTVLQENIAGARVVKSFVREDREKERFGSANEDFAERTILVMQYMASLGPALTVIINAAMVLVVWMGGRQAMEGGVTPGQIVAFINYLFAIMGPLVMMTQLANTWANGIASMQRVAEVLDGKPPRGVSGGIGAPPTEVLPLEFRNVSFGYSAGGSPAVDRVSFVARKGETVAILGATGAGKSSLVSLIPGFYDPDGGEILLAGRNIRTIPTDGLLARIAIVPQETILFTGTVRDNIRYGKPEATDDEVFEAARIAEAHDFILSLANGYDTGIEERGANLSGGQKQRIAIARAILMKPDILILDDSTSAVDVETETRIQDALSLVMRGKTSIVVAQRISTVLNADRIIVMDAGRIVSEGTHAELLTASAVYREIYESQLGDPGEATRNGE